MAREVFAGKGLARRRRMLGWTQHELSRRIGVSVERVVYIETDRTVPTADELQRIRTAFRQRLREVNRQVAAACA